MSVWITSLVQTREVIQMILDKYKVESEPDRFAIFVVKDTGGKKSALTNQATFVFAKSELLCIDKCCNYAKIAFILL